MKCNICGAEFYSGEKECKYCGNELPEVFQTRAESKPAETGKSNAEIHSPDEKISENAERHVFVPKSEKQYCAKCGRPLEGNTGKCIVCEASEVGKYRKDITKENAEEYDMSGSRKRKRKKKGHSIAVFLILFVVMILLFFVSVYFGVELLGGLSKDEEATETPHPPTEIIATSQPKPARTPEPVDTDTNDNSDEASATEPSADRPEDVISYYGGEYLFPSYEKIISENDLDKLERQDIKLILQEIYARYGFTFEDDDLVEYFESQSWYVPTTTDIKEVESKLNKYEKENIEIIEKYQRKKGWRI